MKIMIKHVKNVYILLETIIKLVFAWILTCRNKKNDQLYLIGSNYGNRYDENATVLYRYILKQDKQVYLVLNRPSNCSDQLKRGSFKIFVYYFTCKAIFFTHSLSDVLPNAQRAWIFVKLFKGPTKIFLQHGVIGLKNKIDNNNSVSRYIHNLSKSFDLMVVSSELERELVAGFGVEAKKLVLTGLPRFDNLVRYPNKRAVMVFFTWDKTGQIKSKIIQFLNSDGYQNLLSNGYAVKVVDHPMSTMKNRGQYEVEPNRQQIQKIVNESSLLITDDSSIAWDFFYKNSEVIFFKPSDDWYICDAELSERKAETTKELNMLIDQFLNKSQFSKFKFSRFSDNSNSKRVFELVSI